MGCASSKSTAVKADVYSPPLSSFAVFDINSVKEPWVVVDKPQPEQEDQPPSTPPEKPAQLPATILDKLKKLEAADDAPHSTWVEVSKALEDLKPAVTAPREKPKATSPPAPGADKDDSQEPPPRKNFSFHTLEELDAKLAPKPAKELRKTESLRTGPKAEPKAESRRETSGGFRSVKENIFIQRDREEREKEGKLAAYDRLMMSKRDPFSVFPEKCPPRGEDSLVIYTTTLHGVRRTYEDCNKARSILESHRVVFDERDVALHGEFRTELKELFGEAATVPQVFVKGRHLGGVDELVELNETGRFGRMLGMAGIEKGVGRQACEGCGGARFVPCLDCGGSCKVVVGGSKERCGSCNENGLVHCPACL
ncbi:hypothetical protein CDL15_Pgr018029 [Punica granatum]|uniref:Glutaredoxin domain-containing protein n=1 Tax=Punica granatum TaxID=22663 RepID=A0A218WHI5_PUNGR|nr:hypothetical protein CDL15_Pgr018029 [Punica granatum]PKI77893.1 hypothetical protein CRG98_001685 [Punica granatum]